MCNLVYSSPPGSRTRCDSPEQLNIISRKEEKKERKREREKERKKGEETEENEEK